MSFIIVGRESLSLSDVTQSNLGRNFLFMLNWIPFMAIKFHKLFNSPLKWRRQSSSNDNLAPYIMRLAWVAAGRYT